MIILNKFKSKASSLGWWKVGLIWGAFMYIAMVLLFPLIDGTSLTQRKILLGIPLYLIFGLIYGFTSSKLKQLK